MKNIDRGLTKIELSIYIAIILLILLLFLPKLLFSDRKAKKAIHATIRKNINHQIELFYLNTGGIWPKSMSSSDWTIQEKNINWQDYFPKNFPRYCPFGKKWEIDSKTHLLLPHKGHE